MESMFRFGLEKLLEDKNLKSQIKGKRIGYVAHPASVNQQLKHGLDLLIESDIEVSCIFAAQHGFLGEKQDNMVESKDAQHPKYKIPIHSLYSKTRYPTKKMMGDFDVLLFDLQDVGCRVYTFLTTLIYFMKECSRQKKSLWVLDRPNPSGRTIEGWPLEKEFKSFVGGVSTPIRHGMTLGELAHWYEEEKTLDLDFKVIPMDNYSPKDHPWPGICWLNPSPNIPRLSTAQIYSGSVLLEGTNISEGRGTTRPLEIFGAPQFSGEDILKKMYALKEDWVNTVFIRSCFFEPVFHKFKGSLCKGLQIHVDYPAYDPNLFYPFRVMCLFLKAVSQLYPNFDLWSSPPYEYEEELVPIDLISGSSFLREWVSSKKQNVGELEKKLKKESEAWEKEREHFLFYDQA